MKDEQVATALGMLQDVAARREQARKRRGRCTSRNGGPALRAEARGEFAAELLPALDGLEMALESGRDAACPPAPPGGRSRAHRRGANRGSRA